MLTFLLFDQGGNIHENSHQLVGGRPNAIVSRFRAQISVFQVSNKIGRLHPLTIPQHSS